MDYHQNARLTIHSREQLARAVVVERCTLQAAAGRFQVSAKTAAKCVRRYRDGDPEALSDRGSRPRRCYRPTSSTLLEKGSCSSPAAPQRLAYRPRDRAQPSHHQPYRQPAGMNRLRSLDPPPPVVRCEHKHPRDLIHFDIKRLARIVKPGHRVHGDRSKEVRGAGWEYSWLQPRSALRCRSRLPNLIPMSFATL